MDELSHRPALDDRIFDDDVDRRRGAAAFFIDLVRRVARIELLAGASPCDAMLKGIVMLEAWEEGSDLPAGLPPEFYAGDVEDTVSLLIDRLGAAAAWDWLLHPHPALFWRTPLRTIVAHQVRRVRDVAEILQSPQPGQTEGPGEEP